MSQQLTPFWRWSLPAEMLPRGLTFEVAVVVEADAVEVMALVA